MISIQSIHRVVHDLIPCPVVSEQKSDVDLTMGAVIGGTSLPHGTTHLPVAKNSRVARSWSRYHGLCRGDGLRSGLLPHGFRVTAITDLLSQRMPLEDVQCLAGHAEPRTAKLYERRRKKVTLNIVERLSS